MTPVVDPDEADAVFMARALAEAERGRGWVEPNPMVGAVLVREGRILAVGHHERFGGPHAEIAALGRLGAEARRATLYVTLEPCCHTGKTPPCTEALIAAGLARVVAAIRDPFPKVAGGGFARLEAAGVAVAVGVGAEAAERLNAPYLKQVATGLPYVTAKWAMTLDGKTAVASGESAWISNLRSRALVHELRGQMDAIVVGVGTALVDDPRLTARPAGPRTPARVILDPSARLPLASQLVQTAAQAPILIAVNDRAPADRRKALAGAGCELLSFDEVGLIPILDLLKELGQRGMTNLMVEGGGRTLGAFLDAGQVDAVAVFVAPTVEGGSHPYGPARGRGKGRMVEVDRLAWSEVSLVGGDIYLRGAFPPSWRAVAAGQASP